jgi:hypothetical protein
MRYGANPAVGAGTAAVVAIGAAMGWFWNQSKKGAWELGARTPPWGDKRSIYAHICGHLHRDTNRLTQDGETLPDEKSDGQIRFAPGLMDTGVLSGSGADPKQKATRLHRAITKELENVTDATLKQLYDELLDGSAVEYLDALLGEVENDRRLDRGRLHALAGWLANGAPDREPVKVALALIGFLANEEDRELLLTVGRHDEFTLYSTVALLSLSDGERNVFELAQHVDGWGKIQIVRRLANTADPQIKAWMLRDGYKTFMYEQLAYTCAVTGGLRTELSKDSVDPELIDAAGDLIQALIRGRPPEDMNSYADGARVAELYLRKLGPSPRKVQQLLVVDALLRFLDEKDDWRAGAAMGWTTELRAKLRERCMKVKSLDHWTALIHEALKSKDRAVFDEADQAARVVGIDTWTEHFARLQAGDDHWYFVMQTDDPDRIDRVIALAEERIPLQEVATGPTKALGLGPQWAHHRNLDWVLQDLRRFPGKGWPLLRAGIRSPGVRNRHMALRAFSRWGRDRWPSDASELLATALADEPNDSVRSEVETVLAGNVIEDPKLDAPPHK